MKHLVLLLLWSSVLLGQGYQDRKKQFTESMAKMRVQLFAEVGFLVAAYSYTDSDLSDTLRISDYPTSYEEAEALKKECSSRIIDLLSENKGDAALDSEGREILTFIDTEALDYEGKRILAFIKLSRLFQNGKGGQLIADIEKSRPALEIASKSPLLDLPTNNQQSNANSGVTFPRKGGLNLFFGFPKTGLGVSGYSIREKRVGFYCDVRISIPLRGVSDNPEYYDFINKNTFNDPEISKHWDRVGGNIGVTYAFSNSIILYLGGGFEYRELLLELDDPTNILGDSQGHYWVSSKETKTLPNLATGFIIFSKGADSIGFHIGFHSASKGVDVGLAMALPHILM